MFLVITSIYSSNIYSDSKRQIENYITNIIQYDNQNETIKMQPENINQTCQQNLQINVIKENNYLNNKQILLKIICNDPQKWQKFTTVYIQKIQTIIVASQSIKKGENITRNHLKKINKTNINYQKNNIENIEIAIGNRASKFISKGNTINNKDICLICINDTINILYKTKNIAISIKAIALQNGIKDEIIQFKNTESNKTIAAKVLTQSQASIKNN